MLTKNLGRVPDFNHLRKEVTDLVDLLSPASNQLSCQLLEPDGTDWQEGTGRIDELPEKEERLYKFIHSELAGSYVEKAIEFYKGYRARIMIMPPKQCYSIHADPTARLHIPITTNDQCWMIWPEQSNCVRLHTGMAYWVDTRKNHTFINGSTVSRIHLVMCSLNE